MNKLLGFLVAVFVVFPASCILVVYTAIQIYFYKKSGKHEDVLIKKSKTHD